MASPEATDKPAATDSAREFLESLARDRGSKLLSEAEYHEMRRWTLAELARGPQLRVSTLVTFATVGLILFGFLVVGLAMLLRSGPTEWLLLVSSGGCLLMWGWLLWRYVASIRQQARMSIQERLDEIQELRRHQLISQGEYEELYAAILSCRVPD